MKSLLMAAAAPLALGAALLGGCTMSETKTGDAPTTASATPEVPQATGYFATESSLPFHAPDFAAIKDGDFQSAIEQGIAQGRAEIAAIANNPAAPTFDNTIVAMEKSGSMLSRVMAVFGQLVGANTNDTLDATDSATSPELSAYSDDIYLNDTLFQRVKAVYDARATLGLDAEQMMLVETTYADFVHAGALLDPAQKAQLKQMNGRLAELTTEFSQKLTAATDAAAPVFDTAEELDGLTDDQIAAAAALATEKGMPGKYVIALINTTQQPALSVLTNRETRRKLFEASVNRCTNGDEYDTTGLIAEIADLRAKQAALLGKPNYASWVMYDRMVDTPEKAMAFMNSFNPALNDAQKAEAAELQAYARSLGDDITLQPWDWGYYSEKLRKAKYDIDDAQVKPYFQVWNVMENGVFYAANQMYGLTFKRRTDLPVYHASMRVYDVIDKDGTELGLFYFDPFARSNKQGGAWMSNFIEQSYMTGDKPVIVNTLNIAPPADGQQPLATFDDVTTMFHEFGHALHGFFASQQYPSLSGTNTARDWVEFPSQFNENFATVPAILNHYATHYQTGETIPAELVAKIKAAGQFNQGMNFGETLEAAMLDMSWHRLSPSAGKQDPAAFETRAEAAMGLQTNLIPPRYHSSYFRHIFTNGYAAGYYSYIWTKMLAQDGWNWVETHGGVSRANGDHIRATFLGQGHTKPYSVMYNNFTGHDPSPTPLLNDLGLNKGE